MSEPQFIDTNLNSLTLVSEEIGLVETDIVTLLGGEHGEAEGPEGGRASAQLCSVLRRLTSEPSGVLRSMTSLLCNV